MIDWMIDEVLLGFEPQTSIPLIRFRIKILIMSKNVVFNK